MRRALIAVWHRNVHVDDRRPVHDGIVVSNTDRSGPRPDCGPLANFSKPRDPLAAKMVATPGAAATSFGLVSELDRDNYLEALVSAKAAIQSARSRATLSVNAELIGLYWELGQLIVSRQSQRRLGHQGH